MKRLTWNFNPDTALTLEDAAFKEALNDEQKKFKEAGKTMNVMYDNRNDIYCISPTHDYDMYANYLDYLERHKSEWKSFGYFDLGLIPYLLWPSFAKDSRGPMDMYDLSARYHAPIISVPSVAFLKDSYATVMGKDYWIRREDFVTLVNDYEDDYHNLGYKLNNSLSADCRLSKFVRCIANAQNIARRSHE